MAQRQQVVTERRLWTQRELSFAIELYCRTAFGRLHRRNKEIIELAQRIGRTPDSVALKMTNFASLDPTLDRRGMGNTSKLDRAVWADFFAAPDEFLSDLLEQNEYPFIEPSPQLEISALREGRDVFRYAKVRANQSYFRKMILASYNGRCCITGIAKPELLIASHIVRWADNTGPRLDPRNGLCLNALHDRAFESGLIALDENYRVQVSKKLKRERIGFFDQYEGTEIALPSRFRPSPEFLRQHRERFQD